MRIRLNKHLANRGVAARRKCDALISSGAVRVNGEVIVTPGAHVDPDHDDVRVNGKPLQGLSVRRYFVLNKPLGMISTMSDPQGRRSLRDAMPPGARVFPVGRLDADTSGLLLLTNDGDLAHHLMHPRYGVEKLYRVVLRDPPMPRQIERLQRGVTFEPGVRSAPARVRVRDAVERGHVIEVAITEGRYHQVRRMCEVVGLHVVALHRWGYGPLRLGGLARGIWREISEEELQLLRAASSRPKALPASIKRPAGRRRGEPRPVATEAETSDDEVTSWPAFDDGDEGSPYAAPRNEERDRGGSPRPERGRSARPMRSESPRPERGRPVRSTRGESPRPERARSARPTRNESRRPERARPARPLRSESPRPARARSARPMRGESPRPERARSARPMPGEPPRPERGRSARPMRGDSPRPERGRSARPTRGGSPQQERERPPRSRRGESAQPTRGASPRQERERPPRSRRGESARPMRGESPRQERGRPGERPGAGSRSRTAITRRVERRFVTGRTRDADAGRGDAPRARRGPAPGRSAGGRFAGGSDGSRSSTRSTPTGAPRQRSSGARAPKPGISRRPGAAPGRAGKPRRKG